MAKAPFAQIGLALASTLVCLVALEFACRVLAWRENQRGLEEALANPAPIPTHRPAYLRDVIRLAADDEIIYELRPGLSDVSFEGASVSTNRLGFRGPEVVNPRPANVTRVVGLGDSFIFGWGVEYGDTYLQQLVRLLEGSSPERAWEAVNTGVPGYNTAMEVATLRRKALALDPDIVILGLVENDLTLPNFVRAKHDVFELDRSFLLQFLTERTGSPDAPTPADLIVAPRRHAGESGFESDPDRVPSLYRDMVGWEGFGMALDDLEEMSNEHDFQVLALALWDTPVLARMLEECAKRGFETALVQPYVDAYQKEHGIEDYSGSVLAVSETDPHPSAVTHALMARALLDRLEQSGMLEVDGRE